MLQLIKIPLLTLRVFPVKKVPLSVRDRTVHRDGMTTEGVGIQLSLGLIVPDRLYGNGPGVWFDDS